MLFQHWKHREEETEEDFRVPAWWYDGWEAPPTKAEPTTAKLIPIVTTAPTIDAMELAQTYTRRWPVQENVIKDWLLPLVNDHQYNRDLLLLCQRVNEKQLHLPDGRLLLFQVQEVARPILHQQQRLSA